MRENEIGSMRAVREVKTLRAALEEGFVLITS